MITLEGSITSIIFRNEENLYTVFKFDTPDSEITAVGSLPQAELGTTYELEGDIIYHDKYGEQFVFKTAHIVMPKTSQAIEKYLASGLIPHIGKATAKRLVKKFAEDTLRIMEEEPERLKEIRGLGKVKIQAISKAVLESKVSRDAILFLQDMGFGPSQAVKIYTNYREKTIEIIKKNPYRLIEDIGGIGFKIADRTALKSGFARDSEERILAGTRYVLDYSASQNGDTFLYKDQLVNEASKLLSLDESYIETIIAKKIIEGSLVQRSVGDRQVLYSDRLFDAEELSATRLVQISLSEASYHDIDYTGAFEETFLDDEQKKAVWQVFNNKITVITGGPGTGKTSIVNTIVSLAEANDISYLLAAPTGRAAKRMEESTAREASTIHRMLKYFVSPDGFQNYDHDSENPLEADLIIIDEASMVDIELMARFVDAIPADTSLVLVGDIDQLPSVGPGNVLKDLIKSEIARVITLNKIYRQDEESTIVTNAHRINSGLMPLVNEGKDFFFIEEKVYSRTSDLLIDLVKRRLPCHYKLDPKDDIQVLSVMKKGDLGTYELNKKLQQALNPEEDGEALELGDSIYRVGDKVMQQRNNYDLKYKTKDGTEQAGVFNGDMGVITKVDSKNQDISVKFDDGSVARYGKENLNELMHSYAITIHKSQGSEFPVVVIPIFQGPSMLLTRNLIYTGVTRARRLVVLVGESQILRKMVENNEISLRNSSLDIRIKEKIELFKGVL